MPINTIAAARRATPAEIDAHYERVNAENIDWFRLEMRRRQVAKLIAVLTTDLKKEPGRHNVDSFTCYAGILETMITFEREINRLKDGAVISYDWAGTLLDTAEQAIQQRRVLVRLVPDLQTANLDRHPRDTDEWALSLAICGGQAVQRQCRAASR